MSVLLILIPPRQRAPGGAGAPAAGAYRYVLSPDGLQVGKHGEAAAALLPKAGSVIAVLDDADLSWQRITLPPAPASRLRAALGGVLEEHLLDDEQSLHFALPPAATAGQPTWVAVTQRAWLRDELDRLEKAGVSIDRVVPSIWPGDTPQGHFREAAGEGSGQAHILLSYADEVGASLLRLEGSLARDRLPHMLAQSPRWSATPAVAAPAERWLGASVTVLTDAERALQGARSLWNLRQFDLAPHHRGTLALRDAARRFFSPGWRPVRLGLVTLALLHLVGLNAWAWHQRQAVTGLRQAQEQLLRSSFPQVRAVLDAPVQMQRETDRLRAAAGRAGEDDLEALLGAAAFAWPEAAAPVQTLRFEPGRLSLSSAGWSAEQLAQFRERLRSAGLAVDSAEGRVTISRAAARSGA